MRLPRFIIPLFVTLALLAGYRLRTTFTRPTTVQAFSQGSGEPGQHLWWTECAAKVPRCFFRPWYQNTPGILAIETFATERTAVFTFNPEMITRDRIRAIMETPVPVRDGATIQVFRCLSVR